MTRINDFYKSKKILITGHTGFKGSWMSAFLHQIGSEVQGYSLDPRDVNELFCKASISKLVNDKRGDILEIGKLKETIDDFRPEIVFHFAAQPLVIESYNIPKYTWEVNVMGTLNLLNCLRDSDSVKAIVVITTDKVYKNLEKDDGYTEEDRLGGFDPYSSSKVAVEILVESMYNSFFNSKNIGVATARSGNVIGGGDWAENRLIPDYYRALHNKTSFELRNPSAVRPWQHVLDVLYGYSILGDRKSVV
jgi:CDP-glucose 4,6-dehydratase